MTEGGPPTEPDDPTALRAAMIEFELSLRIERGFSSHTVRAYRSDLDDLVAFARRAGVDGPAGITLELLRDWLWFATQRSLARSTIARRAASARAFTAWLVRSGALAVDPGVRLRSPKPQRPLPRVVSRPQIDGILTMLVADVAREDGHASVQDDGAVEDGGSIGPDPARTAVALRNLAIVELLYASALRVSELVGVDVDDIDFERLTVRVTGKGSKQRVVPFGVPAQTALSEYLRHGRPVLAVSGRPSPTEGGEPSLSGTSPRGPSCSVRGEVGSAPDPCISSLRPCSPTSPAVGRQARTPCATRPRRICSTEAPTCGQCRRCSGTPASAPPRSTRTSPPSGCARAIVSPTPAPERVDVRLPVRSGSPAHPSGSSTARGMPMMSANGDR